MAAKTRTKRDDEPDLLAEMDSETTAIDDDEDFDLLDDMTEDNGTPWNPANNDDCPRGIQGRVLFVSEVEKDQEFGGGFAPLLEIQDRSDEKLIWTVRGYHTVLHNQIEKASPEVGDTIALKYFGFKVTKEAVGRKKEEGYHNYKVVVRRGKGK